MALYHGAFTILSHTTSSKRPDPRSADAHLHALQMRTCVCVPKGKIPQTREAMRKGNRERERGREKEGKMRSMYSRAGAY